MTTLAVLDDVLPLQLKERPDEIAPVRVVWTGTDLDRFRDAARELRPAVLAIDLARLGPDPVSEARSLAELAGSELVLMLYDFAPRDVIRDVQRAGARPVRTPIRLGTLRSQMTSVIVRGILEGSADAPPDAAAADRPSVRIAPERAPAPERRFSRAQLGRLAEIQSSVDCECPNHLSEILLQLGSFEDYSAACKNRNAADAAVHAALHRATGQARAIMEEALAQLIVHERIVL